MTTRTETLFFSLTNGETIRVSLLMHKEIAVENLLCDTFNLPQSYWPIFTSAFKAVNSEMALNGFAYDVDATDGIVACASTKEALAELLEDVQLDEMIAQQGRDAIEKQSGLS